jgi:serine/threonine protein kinase/tetratricopeptide (TPR) repeat protein
MGPKSIDRIFWDAAHLESEAERHAYLDRACSEDAGLRRRVEQLLRAQPRAENFLECPAVPLNATVAEGPVREAPGTVVGAYKLLEQIGEGGFGVVFMAEQQRPVRRRVALKVLKPGMDSRAVIARFEAERQALALMDHPNIATILDAGQTDSGRPYFVMELVKGAPITGYCDRVRLPVADRLELFVDVCHAVQHAHQRGVIHRDLKPSNVLVTLHDGTPVVKVIDFGIAKALAQPLTERTVFTGFAQVLGTPLYMSPEQAALSGLDVDTRSDIYALGVLLYELLTGTTPFPEERLSTLGFDEVLRVIREEEPVRPSTRLSTLGPAATAVSADRKSDPRRLSGLVRGELDWIVLKSLEKDRNRRYATALELAADVRRYLRHEPVQACPPSALYRLRKFARRHKAGLALAGLILLSLVVLGGGAAWTLRDRAAQAAAVRQHGIGALDEAATLQAQAKWPEALEAARRAEGFLAGGGNAEPRQRAREMRTDLEMVLRLEEIRFPRLVGGSEGDWSEAAMDGGFARAFREYGIDVDALEPAEAGERIRARTIRHELAVALDRWVEVRTNLADRNRAANDGPRKRLLAVARAADPDEWRNRLRDALEQRQTETLLRLAASAGGDLPLQSSSLLGWALDFAGAGEQAVAVLRRAQQQYPDDFTINFQLGWALDHQRPPPGPEVRADAIRFYTVARALRPRNVPVHKVLGHALCRQDRVEEAGAMFRKVTELQPDDVLPYHWLALTQLAAGDRDGYRGTCAVMLRQFGGTDRPDVAYQVAWTCVLDADAVPDRDRPVELARAAFGGPPAAARCSLGLGAALHRAGRFGEAIRCCNEADVAARQAVPRTTELSAYTGFFLAMAHHRSGHAAEAREWLSRARTQTERDVHEGLPWNRRLTLRLLRREAEALICE